MIRRHSTPESISTCICIASLLMLMFLCAVPIQQGWSESDIFLCEIIFIIAIIGIAVCFITKSNLRLAFTDTLILVLYGYFLFRYYTDATYPAETMAIHATLTFALYFSLRLIFAGFRINGNKIALMILVYAVYEAGYGIVQLIGGTSRHFLYPVTGSFHNPGPYSACLVMGLAIICIVLYRDVPLARLGTFNPFQRHILSQRKSEKWKSIEWVALQTILLIFTSLIIISMSRTAVIATTLCIFILFWDYIGRWKWWILGLCIAAGVGLYFLKSGSADGRMVINYVGMYAIADNPIFGNGVGSFFHKFAETTQVLALSATKIELDSVDVLEYAFNDWLRLVVELGIVGFLLAASIVVHTLRELWKNSLPLFLTLLTILIFSFFSYPMALLPYRIVTIIIISFAASQSRPLSSCPQNSGKTAVVTIVIFLAVASVCAIKISCIKQLVKAEEDYDMMKGIHDTVLIKDYAPLQPLLEDNRLFLFDYGQILAEAGRYNDSNHILRQGAVISNDPMFLILQGNNFRDMGAYSKAKEMYLKAWHTMPNRIYPLYRLMQLHLQTGEESKALYYAGKIVVFKEKIPSPAVTDIKRKAHEIINLNNNFKTEKHEIN